LYGFTRNSAIADKVRRDVTLSLSRWHHPGTDRAPARPEVQFGS